MKKKTIVAVACALVAPLAFAQTSTTTTETTTEPATTTQTTSTTYTAGTVTTYEPGKTVVVKGEQGPVSFALGTAARVVNGALEVSGLPIEEPSGRRIRNLEATLNGGGPSIDLRVTNGRLRIAGK